MSAQDLPAGFEDLTPMIGWALPTERERHYKRIGSSMEELNAFYARMMARADDVMGHLQTSTVEALDPASRNLFHMALSLSEVAPAVEQYFSASPPDAFDSRRFTIHQ